MNELSADYIKASDLDRRIKVSAQLTQQNLYDMCMGFKEMRDSKLYKELGYSDFGDYCTQETGFSKRSVYNYITIVEKLPQDFVQPLHKIETRKLLLLTQLSEEERSEVTETTDLESITVKELQAKVNDLKKANDRLMNKVGEAEKKADDSRKSERSACEKLSKMRTEAEMKQTRIEQLESQNAALEEQVLELESRPIEVAVQESHEVENMRKAMEKLDSEYSEQISTLQDENIREVRQLNEKHRAELDALRSEYEDKLKQLPQNEITDTKEVFKAYLSIAVDASKRLTEFIKANPDEFYKSQTKKLFETIIQEVK